MADSLIIKPTSGKREVPADKYERLVRKANRRPVIALMGEFSAGKSTLLNFLLGRETLPMKVTATELPPIWLSYGNDKAYRVDGAGNHLPIDDSGDLSEVPIEDTRFIRIYCNAEILRECDLIDMPGISDPNLDRSLWIKTTSYADFVVWCTHATQAWRQSEVSVWTSLPARLRNNSILAVTRSDKLVTSQDRGKVMRRINRETQGLFRSNLMLSTLRAKQAQVQSGEETDLWFESGAPEFYRALRSGISTITEKRLGLLERYQPPASSTLGSGNSSPLVSDRALKLASVRPRRVVGASRSSLPRLTETQAQKVLDETKVGLGSKQPLWSSSASPAKAEKKSTKAGLVLSESTPILTEDDGLSKVREALLLTVEEKLAAETNADGHESSRAPSKAYDFLKQTQPSSDLGGGECRRFDEKNGIDAEATAEVLTPKFSTTLDRSLCEIPDEFVLSGAQLLWRKVIAGSGDIHNPVHLVAAVDLFLKELSVTIGPSLDEKLRRTAQGTNESE